MESCRADWCAACCAIYDIPTEVEVQSVGVPEMHDLSLFLEKDADWTLVVFYMNSRLIEACGQY